MLLKLCSLLAGLSSRQCEVCAAVGGGSRIQTIRQGRLFFSNIICWSLDQSACYGPKLNQNQTSDFLVNKWNSINWPHSGVLWTQKLKTHLLRTQISKVFPLKPQVGQNIAMHALPTARDFFLALISIFLVHSPCCFPNGCWLYPHLPALTPQQHNATSKTLPNILIFTFSTLHSPFTRRT